MLFTIVHSHLLQGLRHSDKCQDRCMTGCGWLAFDEWLAGPVTKSDQLADERHEQRLQALKRGEIPG